MQKEKGRLIVKEGWVRDKMKEERKKDQGQRGEGMRGRKWKKVEL